MDLQEYVEFDKIHHSHLGFVLIFKLETETRTSDMLKTYEYIGRLHELLKNSKVEIVNSDSSASDRNSEVPERLASDGNLGGEADSEHTS
jgi:hypothetical protein